MHDTWGIAGPVFAGLYLALLIVPAVAAALAVRAAKKGRAGVAGSAEELALLTGGTYRLQEYVVAKLLDDEKVRLDSRGRLHRVSGSASDELGRTALEAIGKAGTAVDRVRAALRVHPVADALEKSLRERGLIMNPARPRRIWAGAATAYWLLLALGVVRLIAGISSGHPVGFLIALLVLGLLTAIYATLQATNTWGAEVTSAGRAAATEAKKTLRGGAAVTVAASGFNGHPDRNVRLAVRKSSAQPSRPRARRAGIAGGAATGGYYGGYTGGGSCGGGSSCGGGGSSCGGGGGGCGG